MMLFLLTVYLIPKSPSTIGYDKLLLTPISSKTSEDEGEVSEGDEKYKEMAHIT